MTAKAYLLKIRGGVEVDSKGQKAGKGPLIAEEISNTLGTSQDQYLFQPVDKFVLDDQGGSVIRWRWDGKSPCLRVQMGGHSPVVIRPVAFDGYNQTVTGDVTTTLRAGMSNCSSDTVPCVVLESHPNDSRVKIDDSGSIQTLTSCMGTGGGNVPMVMMPYSKSRRAKSAEDFETWKESRVSNTINTFDQGDVRATDVVVCIQGNVIDRSDNAGANGAGWRLNQCYTLNTIDRPAVVYPKKTGPLMANSHPGSYSGQDAYQDMFVVEKCYSLDEKMGQTYIHEDKANKLAARDFKQPQIVVMSERAMSMVTSENMANTLAATDYKGVQILAIDRAAFNQGENAKYDFQIDGGGTAQTLIARGPGAVCYRKPVCERLQVPTTTASE